MKEGMAWTLNTEVSDYLYWTQVGKFSEAQGKKAKKVLIDNLIEDINFKKRYTDDFKTTTLQPSIFIDTYSSKISINYVPDILTDSDTIDYSTLLTFYYQFLYCNVIEHVNLELKHGNSFLGFVDEEGWLKKKAKYQCFKFNNRLIVGNCFLFPITISKMVDNFLSHSDEQFLDLYVALHEQIEFIEIDNKDKPNLNPEVVTFG